MLPQSFRSSVTQRFMIWAGTLSFCVGLIAVTQIAYDYRLKSAIQDIATLTRSANAVTSATAKISGAVAEIELTAQRAMFESPGPQGT